MSTPPDPQGYYPQEAYYAPGWQTPVGTPPPPRDRRRARAVLFSVGGVLAVGLVVGLVLGGRYLLDTRSVGTVDSPRTVSARQLDVGHCLPELPDDGAISRVALVPCDEPHRAEVVGALTLDGDTWPGQDQVDERMASYCEMDTTQREAGFEPRVWTPSRVGWGQGDRTGLCLAALEDGTATGSFTAGGPVHTD